MAKRGRPTRLTPALREEICRVLRTGCHRSTACKIVGIHYSQFSDWYKKGEAQGRGNYTDFQLAVDKAEAHAEFVNALAFSEAGQIDWKAAKAYLMCRFPERWSPTREENKAVAFDNITVDFSGIPDQDDEKDDEEE